VDDAPPPQPGTWRVSAAALRGHEAREPHQPHRPRRPAGRGRRGEDAAEPPEPARNLAEAKIGGLGLPPMAAFLFYRRLEPEGINRFTVTLGAG
jgi:hypothetical protein